MCSVEHLVCLRVECDTLDAGDQSPDEEGLERRKPGALDGTGKQVDPPFHGGFPQWAERRVWTQGVRHGHRHQRSTVDVDVHVGADGFGDLGGWIGLDLKCLLDGIEHSVDQFAVQIPQHGIGVGEVQVERPSRDLLLGEDVANGGAAQPARGEQTAGSIEDPATGRTCIGTQLVAQEGISRRETAPPSVRGTLSARHRGSHLEDPGARHGAGHQRDGPAIASVAVGADGGFHEGFVVGWEVVPLPRTSRDELVVLRRMDGRVVSRLPIPDDSSATVTIGGDGSLYVGILVIISMLSTEERPRLGLLKVTPARGCGGGWESDGAEDVHPVRSRFPTA